MVNKVRIACEMASEQYLEDLKIKSAAFFLQTNCDTMPVLKLKSYLGINYLYLSKILNDELYFSLSSPIKEFSIDDIDVTITQYAKHHVYKRLLN